MGEVLLVMSVSSIFSAKNDLPESHPIVFRSVCLNDIDHHNNNFLRSP